jgi:hypothetical protein
MAKLTVIFGPTGHDSHTGAVLFRMVNLHKLVFTDCRHMEFSRCATCSDCLGFISYPFLRLERFWVVGISSVIPYLCSTTSMPPVFFLELEKIYLVKPIGHHLHHVTPRDRTCTLIYLFLGAPICSLCGEMRVLWDSGLRWPVLGPWMVRELLTLDMAKFSAKTSVPQWLHQLPTKSPTPFEKFETLEEVGSLTRCSRWNRTVPLLLFPDSSAR